MMAAPLTQPDVARLIAKAESAAWSADASVEWDRSPVRPRWLPGSVYVRLVSQLYHGEIATAAVAGRLSETVEAPEARDFLAVQAREENRHAEAYARYLGKLGGIAPIDPPLADALAEAASWDGSVAGIVVAHHLMLEEDAIDALHELAGRLPCPLLCSINTLVSRDEARHVAFGRSFVCDAAASLSVDERARLAAWAERLWRPCAAAMLEGYAGYLGTWLVRGRFERRWQRHRKTLAALGLAS